MTSYEVQWYSFLYQWIEEAYTLVANIGYQAFRIENPGRGCNNPPPFGGRVTKNTSGGRGLKLCTLGPTIVYDGLKCTMQMSDIMLYSTINLMDGPSVYILQNSNDY